MVMCVADYATFTILYILHSTLGTVCTCTYTIIMCIQKEPWASITIKAFLTERLVLEPDFYFELAQNDLSHDFSILKICCP